MFVGRPVVFKPSEFCVNWFLAVVIAHNVTTDVEGIRLLE